MDRQLRLQVVFAALDKLTSPLRAMRAGSKDLATQLAGTQRELTGLRRAQAQIAQFKSAEARLKTSSAEMIVAQNTTAKLRREIEKVEHPTQKMVNALAKAEEQERKAADRAAEHGHRLQELSGKLGSAGIDVADLARHEAQLGERVQETNRRIDQQRDKLARIKAVKARGEAIQNAGGRIAGAGAVATVGITAPVIAEIRSAIPEAIASQQAMASVNAALKSMGPLARRNADDLQKLAGALQDNSLFDDDDILKSVTANMLTFGNISGTVFDRAQRAVVDLTAKLGGDLQDRTTMIAKALQDPVRGLGALGKTGTLTKDWIAGNKERIAALVKSGKIADAQNEILGELERQYGGTAKAMRDADPTAASQQAWRTFQEDVGGAALEVLPALTDALKTVTSAFSALTPEQRKFLVIAAIGAAAFGPLLGIIGGLTSGVGLLVKGIGPLFVTMKNGAAVAGPLSRAIAWLGKGIWGIAGRILPIAGRALLTFGGTIARVGLMLLANPIVLAIAAIAVAAALIYTYWGPISAFFQNLWTQIKTAFTAGAAAIGQAWSWVQARFAQGLSYLSGIGGSILGFFRGVWNRVGGVVAAGGATVGRGWQALKGVFVIGLSGLSALGSQFATIGGQLLQGLVKGMLGAMGWVKDQIVNVGANVVGWFKKKLGIHSPSRVFAQLGGHIMSGLSLGLERNGSAPIAAMRGVSDRLTRAMAASALAMTPAAAIATPARSGSPFGSASASAPFGGARPKAAPSAPMPVAIGPFHFHGVAADDAEQLARAVQEAVERALEKHDRKAKADRRSSYEEQD